MGWSKGKIYFNVNDCVDVDDYVNVDDGVGDDCDVNDHGKDHDDGEDDDGGDDGGEDDDGDDDACPHLTKAMITMMVVMMMIMRRRRTVMRTTLCAGLRSRNACQDFTRDIRRATLCRIFHIFFALVLPSAAQRLFHNSQRQASCKSKLQSWPSCNIVSIEIADGSQAVTSSHGVQKTKPLHLHSTKVAPGRKFGEGRASKRIARPPS